MPNEHCSMRVCVFSCVSASSVEHAVETSHFGLFFNQGQCCCAGSRIFVEADIYDDFIEASAERAKKRTMGDPFDPNNEQGPQVRAARFLTVAIL